MIWSLNPRYGLQTLGEVSVRSPGEEGHRNKAVMIVYHMTSLHGCSACVQQNSGSGAKLTLR